MAELERVIEERLINQLCNGNSQWTYRNDIRSEDQLWANFKYILEQNNKNKLNEVPLTDEEFAKIKNDVSHSSFYEAGEWLVGENGKVYVHIQRGSELIHLMVLNNEHIAGGTSVYEVINQYQAFKEDDDERARSRRFDVTLLINGIPMIHIELKNKDHSYIDGYNQIKKYIAEGKFRGLFSNVQMFVVSNEVDTKYFAPARDSELKQNFMTRWLDPENNPVSDYLEFARAVLRIPEAHEMIARYTVLDRDKKRLQILRPYQVHAIEAMRNASRRGESGFIWHTTGSGKTMTSYKATRNLLMDIPSIDLTVFLIDRKDLDEQTTMAFKSYSYNDSVDVEDTDYTTTLIDKMASGERCMIVTTVQKMQRLLKKTGRKIDKIKRLKVAFVVDECHRAVTPQTKRDLENFFVNSLWYGFTGTPIFEENGKGAKGDLPQTTAQMYGGAENPLHSYTIKEAIHDGAVLGFFVENLGSKNGNKNALIYESEVHMRAVTEVIFNKCAEKLGFKNGKGQTYSAILTCSSIQMAQKYYDYFKKVKEGKDELKISEEIIKQVPDFPRFAITYSISENGEASNVNQDKMAESIRDYNKMFGTHCSLENIRAYNSNLNSRLARKEAKYFERSQQLDIVIVVDRLLTGFDAPCLSTLFIDRQPRPPHEIIQAFSRTNRLYDKNKLYGQIVTFQSPLEWKEAIDDAIALYSRGGEGNPIVEDFDTIYRIFKICLKALKELTPQPSDVPGLSKKQKKMYVKLFRDLDKSYAHLRAFSNYESYMIEELGFSHEQYEDYAAQYKNVLAELKEDKPEPGEPPVFDDYELVSLVKTRVDYEYIVEMLRGFMDTINQDEEDSDEVQFSVDIAQIKQLIIEYSNNNPKLGKLIADILDDIIKQKDKYVGQDISVIINVARYAAIDAEIKRFADKWYLDFNEVKYEAYNYHDGKLQNETKLKENADYAKYKEETDEPLAKFLFYTELIKAFRNDLMEEILPLFT
ncbi:type I restriction enzyme, R subunit [Pseudobutyrivibrio sp. OR37]|uniref:type I restriction endonuclease subunit R n=1 Tax=Pseudobutyrivibrio sp. OR37 TaxID=1798186 RepID=UPI0008F3B791|nr:type I restriction endonuclease subunit R [Pseudobutyrivibrio sp. OR37]SFH76264.1 type I restriction enzyme, R subunit [Pseudobutyrivibrio sp. OR37]